MDINTENAKSFSNASPLELAEEIVRILDSKKANKLTLLHVTDQTVITDYFVICTGNSNTQIKSLADELEHQLKLRSVTPNNIEGFREASWVLLDYSSVIVHIFNREARDFYNLEKLWADAEEVSIDGIIDKKED